MPEATDKRKRRNFTAPVQADRCIGSVTLDDGSGAQCMHRKQKGRDYCRQHGRYIIGMSGHGRKCPVWNNGDCDCATRYALPARAAEGSVPQ